MVAAAVLRFAFDASIELKESKTLKKFHVGRISIGVLSREFCPFETVMVQCKGQGKNINVGRSRERHTLDWKVLPLFCHHEQAWKVEKCAGGASIAWDANLSVDAIVSVADAVSVENVFARPLFSPRLPLIPRFFK